MCHLHARNYKKGAYFQLVSSHNVCGRAHDVQWTSALRRPKWERRPNLRCDYAHTSLAGKRFKPRAICKIAWTLQTKVGRIGLEPTEPEGTRFTVWPATNYDIPTRGVTRGNRTPISRATICRTNRYTIVTVTPAGLEPGIFGLKGRCPNL